MYRCRGVWHTPHECPWQWANDSSTRYVSIKYVLIESYSRQKIDSPLKPPTRNDPFSVYRCRGVWHTPHKYPWPWANESPARYVSIKYVLIESYSRQGLDSPSPIESYTRQKFDSPLKYPICNDQFSVYQCRGVSHTPHKCPWPWANDSSTRYVSIKYVLIESFSRKGLDSPYPIESYSRQGLDSLSLIESYTRKELDSPLKSHTRNDPFSVYRCRGVLHTPHKCPWQWANDSSARYVSIKYVSIESYTHQKLDSPLKRPTHNDPFLGHRCMGVWNTSQEFPW